MELDTTDTGGGWTPHDEGQFAAICVDVIEHPKMETQWGIKDKVQVMFITDAPFRDDNPQSVSAWFTASMHPKARLREFVEAWFGKKLPKDQTSFDTDVLVGCKATIQVIHNTPGDTTYANINTIMKAPRGCKLTVPEDYERHKDRAENRESLDEVPAGLAKDDDDGLPW